MKKNKKEKETFKDDERKNKKTVKEDKKRKKKITNILYIIIILILVCALGFSVYKIINWDKDNKNIKKQEEQIKQITDIKEVDETDNKNIEIIKQDEIAKENPYWDFIKTPLISVNFDELKKKNPDTVGWIKVDNTNINYPVVKCSNNDYYLNHAFDETWNDAGWIFMDYRNNPVNFDKNTIIYGHSRVDMSMFGTLRNVVKQSWFNNKDNHIIKLSTPTENTMWQVFSTYKIKAEDYYLQTKFENDSEYQTWLNEMLRRSQFKYGLNVSVNDKVLTLSSCFDTKGTRVVLHAKLIKKEVR